MHCRKNNFLILRCNKKHVEINNFVRDSDANSVYLNWPIRNKQGYVKLAFLTIVPRSSD